MVSITHLLRPFRQVTSATSALVFHAKELELHDPVLRSTTGTTDIAVEGLSLDASKDTATLGLSTPLAPGQYLLRVSFRGILNDKLAGFYRSKYVLNGTEHVIATTQFEATDARRAFPCWDEPAFKGALVSTRYSFCASLLCRQPRSA